MRCNNEDEGLAVPPRAAVLLLVLVVLVYDDDDKFLTIKTKLTHYGQGTMQATRYKTHEYK